MTRPIRLCVLASHAGTTFQAIMDACAMGPSRLDAQIALLISNNSASGAMARARGANIECAHFSAVTHPELGELDAATCRAMIQADVDVVVLAGYMKKLGPKTLEVFAGRILNTHPALLPLFGGPGMFGMNVHRAVIAAGAITSGASVHVVEADYDTGPVIAQRAVPVHATDSPESLAERVQSAERTLLVEVLGKIASGELALPFARS